MMKRILLIVAVLLPAAMANALGSGCQATTGPLSLEKLRSNAVGSELAGCINRSFDTLSASSVSLTGSTSTASNLGAIYVNRIGGRSTGAPGITISSATTLEGSSLTIRGGGGIGVTYGITAASGSFTGGPGVAVTYGITAATGAFSGPISAGQSALTYGITAATGVFVNRVSAADFTATYGVTAATAAFSSGITASSGSFKATGAAQYSIASSSSIILSQGVTGIGIRWADGSITTAAPPMVTAAASLGTTWQRIATATVSGVSSYTFGSDVVGSTRSYEVKGNGIKWTGGILYVRASGDTGGNYQHESIGNNSFNGGIAENHSNTETYCPFTNSADALADGQVFKFESVIETAYSKPKLTSIENTNKYWYSTPYINRVHVSCYHNGSAVLSSITIAVSAGTFDGFLELWEEVRN